MSSSETLFNVARDIHPFDETKPGPIKLAGISVESEYGLNAHSDGDVVLHAIIDAILGILAIPEKRDIGSLFPDNAPEWKDADSQVLMKEILTLAQENKLTLKHMNVQIACHRPRLSEHYEDMVQSLSKITALPKTSINIQSMSNNGCGEEGQGKAISALACISAVKSV